MTAKVNRVSLTARVIPTLKKALEEESRNQGQTTSNYVESILLHRGASISDDEDVIDDLHEQLEKLQSENAALQEQLSHKITDDELAELAEDALDYEEKINALNEYIEQLVSNQENHIPQEVYDKLAFEKSNLASRNETLQAQNDDLTEQLQNTTYLNQEKEDLHLKFLQLQESQKFLRMKNTDLKEQVQQLTKEVEITEEALDQVTEHNQTLVLSQDARVEELTDELNEFKELGYSTEEIELLEEENNELHNRVDKLEMQLIEQQQSHESAILAEEEEDTVNPNSIEELQDTIDGHMEHISNLEEEIAEFEDKMLLDLTTEQVDEIDGYFEKLRKVYDGRTNEELVLGALYCGVRNERAFFRVLVGEYLER